MIQVDSFFDVIRVDRLELVETLCFVLRMILIRAMLQLLLYQLFLLIGILDPIDMFERLHILYLLLILVIKPFL